ncbi:MAG: flagellar hook-associated protein FlgL [Betaproteobacteria bacterium]
MRVSTGMLFEASTRAVLRNQADLLRTQQQMSTGRRLLAPSDDPVAASQALGVRAEESVSAQHAANRSAAREGLELAEGKLAAFGDLLSGMRTLVIAAGSGSLAAADRDSIAAELRGLQAELLGMANASDGHGRYLFAGYQDGFQPFTQTAAGVVYNGDQGSRALAVGGSRRLAVSENGHSIFESGRSGNGVFKATLPGANVGTAAVGIGGVHDATLLTGHAYRVVFTAGGYDVLDLTAGVTLSTANPYTSGAAIRFDGIEIAVQGVPADGDAVDVAPSVRRSLFSTLQDAIAAAGDPAATPAAAAQRNSKLALALSELDSGADRVLAVRAEFGARLRELDDLGALGEGENVLLAARRSRLEDLDYAAAASAFQRQQLALEAAQQTQVRMTAMSLFDFMR